MILQIVYCCQASTKRRSKSWPFPSLNLLIDNKGYGNWGLFGYPGEMSLLRCRLLYTWLLGFHSFSTFYHKVPSFVMYLYYIRSYMFFCKPCRKDDTRWLYWQVYIIWSVWYLTFAFLLVIWEPLNIGTWGKMKKKSQNFQCQSPVEHRRVLYTFQIWWLSLLTFLYVYF